MREPSILQATLTDLMDTLEELKQKYPQDKVYIGICGDILPIRKAAMPAVKIFVPDRIGDAWRIIEIQLVWPQLIKFVIHPYSEYERNIEVTLPVNLLLADDPAAAVEDWLRG